MAVKADRWGPRDPYLRLIRAFSLRPIRSEDELDEAIRVIDSLLDREHLEDSEQDYLDVLSDLVERYEANNHPMPPLPDADMLRHLIEAKGVTQVQVSQETGIANSTISEILAGKRALRRAHIAKLAHYFAVEPGVFSLK